MFKKILTSLFLVILSYYVCCGQSNAFVNSNKKVSEDSLDFIQIKTDSIFNSHQIISLLTLQKNDLKKFRIEISYCKSDLKTTSSFGKNNHAEAAINGSFFDRDSGGSVTYFEINDTVISKTKSSNLKWAKPDSLINGAIEIMKDSSISIQPASSDQYYELSKQEIAVLVAGPLLLYHSKKMRLPNMKFTNDRHPRTCLCETKESLLFITIDGRKKEAEGMSLLEVQTYLKNIGCVDAINLDGGGSTTLWIKDKGIVNFTSDDAGERPVANALLIIKK